VAKAMNIVPLINNGRAGGRALKVMVPDDNDYGSASSQSSRKFDQKKSAKIRLLSNL
jgi:hypothetical protein